MKLSKINSESRLYVIECGAGFSCYGFDVLDRKARAVALWIGAQSLVASDKAMAADWLKNRPAVGTAEHFAACDEMMTQGAAFSALTGKRCGAELVPALVGLEGRRIECDYYGERVRFNVGKSTGWMPAHLKIHNSRSHGGEALAADSVSNVRVIR